MVLTRRGTHCIIICSVLILGFALGSILVGPAVAKEIFNNPKVNNSPIYPVNENGQTYGSGDSATSIENEPDLIAAAGVDGTIGYVLSTDLNGRQPKTPEEAVEITRLNQSRGGRIIPLYDYTGKNVIGEFKISAGTFKELSSTDLEQPGMVP